MATLAQFSQNIFKKSSQIENAATRVVRATSKRALKALVYATPVDEGVARSNWRVGVGAAPTAFIKAYAPGKKLGLGERGNANAAIAAGFAKIETVRGVSGRGGGLKKAVYIANNAPYIERLNSGYSSQAPAGFIEIALSEVHDVIQNFRVFTRSQDEEGE
jgi:hypothetical protein